jgi:hypothetical protein
MHTDVYIQLYTYIYVATPNKIGIKGINYHVMFALDLTFLHFWWVATIGNHPLLYGFP